MTLAEQYEHQLARALIVRDFQKSRLLLVRVKYPDSEPRISIVGGAINLAAIECWQRQGASVVTVDILE